MTALLPIEADTAVRVTTRRPQFMLMLVALAWTSFAAPAFAQNNATPDLPSSRPLDAPSLPQPGDLPKARTLLEPRRADDKPARATRVPRIFVRSIEIRGNTVLPQAELAEIARGFVDRLLEGHDLEELRTALTQRYRDAGYVGSGALLPDQDFEAGLLVVTIVEARLGEIALHGLAGYAAEYLRARIADGPDEIVNIGTLGRRLQVLRNEPYIRSLHAELRPSSMQGVLRLDVEIVEARRYGGNLAIDNYQPPAIGAVNSRMGFSYANVSGWGDSVSASTGLSEGVVSIGTHYRAPVSRRDTRLDLQFRYTATEIIDPEFEDVDFKNRYIATSLSLAHPLYRTPSSHFEIGLTGEWRESRSTLDGFAYDSTDAARNGRVRRAVLRLFQDFVHRGANQVFAARSTASFGLNALGATSGPLEPAGFISWLGQVQWVHRFDPTGIELFARGNAQLALDPLVPFERFSVGGRYSVRGHRQNQLVSDNGFAVSVESRFPLLRDPDGRSQLQFVPFIDFGRGWFRRRGGEVPGDTLAAAGVGMIWHPTRQISAELFYGIDFSGSADTRYNNPQEHGIHFQLSMLSF